MPAEYPKEGKNFILLYPFQFFILNNANTSYWMPNDPKNSYAITD
jgi:hypothetical protein